MSEHEQFQRDLLTDSLDNNAPLSLDEIRKRLAARERCEPRCKGWDIFDSDAHGLMVQACDDCFAELHEDHLYGYSRNERGLYDSDIAQLPEAMDALALARAEADCKPRRVVFHVEIVTDVGHQAIENTLRRALDEAEVFTYSIIGCEERPL